MKRTIYILVAVLIIAANAAPNFVTPAMIQRNGLTDAQYELLWSQGKNPHVTQAVARDWIFKASRYQNVTNWLGIVGKTNDFARLSQTLTAEREKLIAANTNVTAQWKAAREKAAQFKRQYAGATNNLSKLRVTLEAASNNLAAISASWTSATNKAARAERIKAYLEAKRDEAKLTTTKKIYQAIIDEMEK